MSRLVERIVAANAGREPQRLALKYAAMAESPFRFFRGSAHLFYEDWPRRTRLDDAPLGWICGDLHLENFGSYKGDDRQIYFDVNDFDEAALAPATWELARVLASIHLAADELGATRKQARAWARHFVDAWCAALADGKAGWIVRASAQGPVRTLLDQASERTRAAFLDRRTTLKDGKRHFLLDGKHALPASRPQQREVAATLRAFAATQAEPAWFRTLDVARRIAGTGSLGVARYAVLVRGKGSPDRNYLLDLKQARASALAPLLRARRIRQPRWDNDAERIVAVQQRVQAVSPAKLAALRCGADWHVLKELQPREDRLDLSQLHASDELETALGDMARASAWSLLRSGGRQGSACADDWIRFARKRKFEDDILRYAEDYAEVARKDWKRFRKDAGGLLCVKP